MNCWEILGIEPTPDRSEIDAAFERQKSSASGSETRRLNEAYRQALAQADFDNGAVAGSNTQLDVTGSHELTARDQQIAREIVIQIQALINDSGRSGEAQIWRAILAEPPADQPLMKARVGEMLEQQVKPMAENGVFPVDVCRFLDEWFGWESLTAVDRNLTLSSTQREEAHETNSEQDPENPQMTNFWPAVVGWIVGLAILASLFSGLGGGH